jgi:hypothetical protein
VGGDRGHALSEQGVDQRRMSTGTRILIALLSFVAAAVVLSALLFGRGAPEAVPGQLDLKPTEQGRTYQDLLAIRGWVWKCVTAKSERDEKVPYDMLAAFWVPGLYDNPGKPKPGDMIAGKATEQPTIHRPLTAFEDALVYLTKVVSSQRLELADEVDRQTIVLRWITWGGIAVAFLTSLIVTMKSSDIVPTAGEWRRRLEFAAIMLAAFSATQVSLVGTLSPAGRLADAKVILERLRQLHTQMAFDLIDLHCAEGGTDRADAKILMRGWQQRYQTITVGQAAQPAAIGPPPPSSSRTN